jgi:hypothetical protein
VLVSILVAGVLSAISTSWQLNRRLSTLRPLSSGPRTAWLVVLVVVLSALVSAAVASVQLLPAGGSITSAALGIGTSVPIAGGPKRRSQKDNVDEEENRDPDSSAIVQHLNEILELIGSIANRAENTLIGLKTLKVERTVREIQNLTRDATSPPYEHISLLLETMIEDSSSKSKDLFSGQLRGATKAADPLTRMIRLAYELGQEELILTLVRERTSPGPTPPANPS